MISRQARRRNVEDGFTLIELTVAATVILIALTALSGFFVSTLKTVTIAKQRQQATALANQAIEAMRAVPYSTLVAGLNVNDLGDASESGVVTDPNITGSNFTPQYDPSIIEPLQTSGTVGSPPAGVSPPLYPHITKPQLDPADTQGARFKVRNYVTLATTAPPSYNLTSIVSWTSAVVATPKTVALRTRVFSPTGCLDLTKHPFSGPCQAQFKSVADTGLGSITLSPTQAGLPLLPGAMVKKATLALAEVSQSLQVEQVTSVTGQARSSQVFLDEDAAPNGAGGVTVTALADTDPSNPNSTVTTATLPAQTSGARSSVGTLATITLTPTTADGGSLTDVTNSAASPACRSADDTRTLATGQPCGSGVVTTGGSAAAAALSVNSVPGRALQLAGLAAGTSTRVVTPRLNAVDTTYCPAATGLGCVAAHGQRAIGDLVLGALDTANSGTFQQTSSGMPTAIFSGLLKLTAYRDEVLTRAGQGAGGAVTPNRTGTLSYWTPDAAGCSGASLSWAGNYCTVNLASGVARVLSATAVATYADWGGQPLTVTMSAQVNVPSINATTVTGAAPCATASCTAAAGIDSPLTATIRYQIRRGLDDVADFTQKADLGRLSSTAIYKAAPSA